MAKKHKTKEAQNAKKPVDDECCSCAEKDSVECEEEVRAANGESVRRFLGTNQENISKSSKEQIATASYGGGMMDTIATVRSALGKWAVEQLLIELGRRQKSDDSSEELHCNIRVTSSSGTEGLSPEDAKELGEQIAKWIEGRNGNGKRQGKDPMYA